MENSKNTSLVALAIIVLVVAGIFVYSRKHQPPAPAPSAGQEKQTMPPFILGTFEKVDGQKLFLKVGAEEKTVLLADNTRIVKQVADKSGKITLVDIKAAQLKANSQIVVYYSTVTGNEYKANKIQVISP